MHIIELARVLFHVFLNFKQNPITSVGQLVTKLQSIENLSDISNTHPIFYSILKCPLVHPFIFPLGSINSADHLLSQQEKVFLLCWMELLVMDLRKRFSLVL
jgi:hypothetical protein